MGHKTYIDIGVCQSPYAVLGAINILQHLLEGRVEDEDVLERERPVTLPVVIERIHIMVVHEAPNDQAIFIPVFLLRKTVSSGWKVVFRRKERTR